VAYQWYFNNQPIQGATSETYVAPQSGNYVVQITDSNGCSYRSSGAFITGIADLEPGEQLVIYPNPLTSGDWELTVPEKMLGALLQIFDADGRIIFKGELNNSNYSLPLNVSRGIYWMKVTSGQLSYSLKLVKL
jgi:hypothetical protein